MRLDVGYGSVSSAGYGSAGGQPERRTMPKGPLPPCRAVGFACGAARFIEAFAHWPNAENSGGLGGRAPHDGPGNGSGPPRGSEDLWSRS